MCILDAESRGGREEAHARQSGVGVYLGLGLEVVEIIMVADMVVVVIVLLLVIKQGKTEAFEQEIERE
jgi:hypothetical protein